MPGTSGAYQWRASSLAWATMLTIALSTASTALLFRDAPRMGTLFNQLLSVGILGVLAVLALSGAVTVRRLRWSLASVSTLLLVTLVAASAAWSQATAGAATVTAYAAGLVVDVAVVLLLAAMAPAALVLQRAMAGYAVGTAILLGLVVGLGWRDESGRLGDAAYLHPNSLGFQLAIAALIALFLGTYRDRAAVSWHRGRWQLLALVLTIGLLGSLSKTAIAAFAGGVLVLFARGDMSRAGKAASVLLGSTIIVLASGRFSAYWTEYLGSSGRSLRTLTGRTEIWEATWPRIEEHLMLGHGLLAFRDAGPQIADVRLVHAHNEVVQLLFAYGVVGLVLALCAYGGLAWQLRRARLAVLPGTVSMRSILLAIGAFVVLRGITEANQVAVLYPPWLLLLGAFWAADQRAYSRCAQFDFILVSARGGLRRTAVVRP